MLHSTLNSDMNQVDRRSKSRLACNYPARVRGYDPDGRKFDEQTVLSNLSASGVFLHLNQKTEPGKDMFVLINLSQQPRVSGRTGFSIAARGVIVRSEPGPEGGFGVAIAFKKYRLI